MSENVYYKDIYQDIFITHGGLLSKKTIAKKINEYESKSKHKFMPEWKILKSYVLSAIHTHLEVQERQPILIKLFAPTAKQEYFLTGG